jgi:RimJ/RimL family protein N-acetyltransferase
LIEFVTPTIDELAYRQHLMADSETMSYNAEWTEDGTGCIPQTDEQLRDWYQKHYLKSGMFYAYVFADNAPVGEVAISPAGTVSVIIEAKYRNHRYGQEALRKLCELAFTKLGREFLVDNFPTSRTGAKRLFANLGFERINAEIVKLSKETWLRNQANNPLS